MKTYGGSAIINGIMFSDGSRYSIGIKTGEGYKFFTGEKEVFKHKIFKLPVIRGICSLISVFAIQKIIFNALKSTVSKEKMNLWKNIIYYSKSIVRLIIELITLYLFVYYIPINISNYLYDNIMPNVSYDIISTIMIYIFFITMIILMFKYFNEFKTLKKYHGAEHKIISCYESGKDITVENVKLFSTLHPRCGSSLIGFILLAKVILFNMLITGEILDLLIMKFIALPLMFSIGYEMFKVSAKYDTILLRPIKRFGFFMQGFTTAESSDEQIELGIMTFKKLLENE